MDRLEDVSIRDYRKEFYRGAYCLQQAGFRGQNLGQPSGLRICEIPPQCGTSLQECAGGAGLVDASRKNHCGRRGACKAIRASFDILCFRDAMPGTLMTRCAVRLPKPRRGPELLSHRAALALRTLTSTG